MGYNTTVSLNIYSEDYKHHEAIARTVMKEFTGNCDPEDHVKDNYGFFDLFHYWGPKESNFFKKLSKRYHGTIIELAGEGEDAYDRWIRRFLDGKVEHVDMVPYWPPFEEIMTEEEQVEAEKNKPTTGRLMKDCLARLDGIKHSGYIPYASPAPSSTEVKIKDAIDRAYKSLQTALELHASVYGSK